MASSQYDTISHLITKIKQTLPTYETWQIVYLLDMALSKYSTPGYNKINFYADNRLSYPASEISEIEFDEQRTAIEIYVNYMGLTGVSGILPQYITEMILKKRKLKDNILGLLLDCIQQPTHRFYYQAWKKSQVHLQHNENNRILKSLIQPDVEQPETVALRIKLAHFTMFARQTRTAQCLSQLIESYIFFPVKIQEFSNHTVELSNEEASKLSTSIDSNNRLGINFTIGTTINMDVYHFTVLIYLNVNELDVYRKFHRVWEIHIKKLVSEYLGDKYDYNIKYQFSGIKQFYLSENFYLL